MRRRLIHTLSLFCLGVLLALLIQYVFEKKIILGSESSAGYKVNRILKYTDKNEIPIFGPSTAQSSLIPSMLGPDYFNYGIDGVGDDVMLFFLEHECRKTKTTPYIISVMNMQGFTYGLGDINGYLMNADDPDVRKLMGDRYKFYYRIPFIKYYGQYDNYLKDYLNDHMQLTKYKDRGASIEKNAFTKEKFHDLVIERMNSVSRFHNDSSLSARFINVVKGNPAREFILIIPPVHPSCFEKFQNYDDALKFYAYLSAFPNVKVLNYSRNFYPDDCYMNTMHLNYKGAVQFTSLIQDTLSKILNQSKGILPSSSARGGSSLQGAAVSRKASASADSPSFN